MGSHGFDQYLEHEDRIVARREKDLAAHKERLARQAARLTEVLSALGARRDPPGRRGGTTRPVGAAYWRRRS